MASNTQNNLTAIFNYGILLIGFLIHFPNVYQLTQNSDQSFTATRHIQGEPALILKFFNSQQISLDSLAKSLIQSGYRLNNDNQIQFPKATVYAFKKQSAELKIAVFNQFFLIIQYSSNHLWIHAELNRLIRNNPFLTDDPTNSLNEKL